MSLSRRDPDHSGEKAPPLARSGAKFTRTVGAVDGEGYQSQSPAPQFQCPSVNSVPGGGGRIFGSHLRRSVTLLTKSAAGDVHAIREIGDRMDGRVPQAVTGDADGDPITVRTIVTGVKREGDK